MGLFRPSTHDGNPCMARFLDSRHPRCPSLHYPSPTPLPLPLLDPHPSPSTLHPSGSHLFPHLLLPTPAANLWFPRPARRPAAPLLCAFPVGIQPILQQAVLIQRLSSRSFNGIAGLQQIPRRAHHNLHPPLQPPQLQIVETLLFRSPRPAPLPSTPLVAIPTRFCLLTLPPPPTCRRRHLPTLQSLGIFHYTPVYFQPPLALPLWCRNY